MILPIGVMRGVRGFFRGLSWLRSHPGYLLLLFLPMLLGFFFLAGVWAFIWRNHDIFFTYLMYARPESFFPLLGYYLVKGILYIAVVILSFLSYLLFLNVISSPIYDRVSFAIEKDILGRAPFEITVLQSLGLMGEEVKKSLIILALNMGILFIPGVNVLAPLVAAFCLGWGVYDYPMARRGFSFRKRATFVLQHGWTVLGLGLVLIVPGVSIVMLPLAVAGGTILAVEDLSHTIGENR